MPGLRFYGRKWQFGADDLTIPACVCSLTRATWVSLLGVLYAALKDAQESCPKEVTWFTNSALAIYCITLFIYLSMLIISCRGTVLETEKRWCTPSLFRVLIIFVFFEAFLTIYGTYVVHRSEHPCEEDSEIPIELFFGVVIGSWVDLTFSVCCGCLAVTWSSPDDKPDEDDFFEESRKNRSKRKVPLPRRSCYCWGEERLENPVVYRNSGVFTDLERDEDEVNEEEAMDHYEFHSDEERESDSNRGSSMLGRTNQTMYEEEEEEEDLGRTPATWNVRCRRVCSWFQCFTCGLFGGINGTGGPEAYQEVAVVLAGWFKNLGLVPSDIVTALFLMRAEQREMENSAVQALLREQGDPRQMRRRAFTHVGRWMWPSHGPTERANSQLHAQQIRESRDARRIRDASRQNLENDEEESQIIDLDPEAKLLLLQAAELAPYMIGMYGWLLFSYMHGIRGWFTLLSRPLLRYCCCCCRRREEKREQADDDPVHQFLSPPTSDSELGGPRKLFVLDDGCCEWNTTALVEGVSRGTAAQADVVYASFTSFVGQKVPYCVCVDHSKRRVIVAVRGTLTLADAITHVTMFPAPLALHAAKWGFQDEIEPDSHAHAGMLRVAAWMRSDLQRQDILHQLFGVSVNVSPPQTEDVTREHDSNERGNRRFSVGARSLPDCRGYSLELTGHSLGGGIAVILSLFLRPVFPHVRCLAFSPPGCVFDWKLANKCSSWVSCIFVGKDFAPRVSWHSLFKLRGQILDTLRRDKATKIGAIVSSLAGRPIDTLLYKSDQVPDSKHTRQMEKKIDELASRKPSLLDSIRLFAPGKLLHLMKDETFRKNCCSAEKHFVPMWIDDRSALDEILLSRNMAFDHFPDVVDSILKEVVKEYCIYK